MSNDVSQAALAALIREDHHAPLPRRASLALSADGSCGSTHKLRHCNLSDDELTLPIEEEVPATAEATNKMMRRRRLSSLKARVARPSFHEMQRVSGVLKIDPKLRLVPFDRSALTEFQTLLRPFEDVATTTPAVDCVLASLNDLRETIISSIFDEQDTLNNSRLAREISIQAVALFVSGIDELAAATSTAGAAHLRDMARRLGVIDAFVRTYFINEIHELEQVVNSLEDSLEQANKKLAQLQTDVASTDDRHKRKLAEVQFFSVVNQARARAASPALATTVDSKFEEAHHELLKAHHALETTHARLETSYQTLLAQHETARRDLEQAQRKVSILTHDVEELSQPLALDIELQQLQAELLCERRRVKELEFDMVQTRMRQIDATRAKVTRASVVTRMRRATDVGVLPTTQEIATMAANVLEYDSDEVDEADLPDISFETLMSKDPAKRLLSMLNYSLPPPPTPPVALRQMPDANLFASVATAVSKLKLHAHVEASAVRALEQSAAPSDLAFVRQTIRDIFERKRLLDECASIAHEPRETLVEVVVGFHFARFSEPAMAQKEAIAFLDLIYRLRCVYGDVRMFAEFLDGAHSDEVLDFYVWLVQSMDQIPIGAELDSRPEVHPHYISKFKATLLTRTLFRTLRFRTCGFANHLSPATTSLQRHPSLDAMYDCQRLFEHTTARGPIYLGEFHDLLDAFRVHLHGEECYPLDVFLYALVLMYKKQKDWFFESVRLLFNQVHDEAVALDTRQRALEAIESRQTEATKARRRANEAPKPSKKVRKPIKRRRGATPDARKTAVLTTIQFAVVLARLDTHLSFGQMTEMTVKILSTRRFYSHGITFEAFVYTATSLGWFRPDFASLPAPFAEISISNDEKTSAQAALQYVWDTHVASIYVACEGDSNPFVAKHVMQIKQRLVKALSANDHAEMDPLLALTLLRHLMHVCWRVGAARGFRSRHTESGSGAGGDHFYIAELARSDELILIAKGILAIPDAVTGHQVFNAALYTAPSSDFMINFSHIDPARIRDLFHDHCIHTNECVAIDSVLQRYAWQLNDVYRSYSLVCNNLSGITRGGFEELMHDLRLGSSHFTNVHMSLIFAAVVSRQPETDRLLATSFIELMIRLAAEKHAVERPFIDRKQSKLQLVQPERVAVVLEDLCTRYLLPNICQNLSITFRRQVAAPELQRLLNRHRNLLRRLYLYYCRQDIADMEAWKMNFGEFERFIQDFGLNDAVFFPSSMNLIVFNACQDDLNEGQFIYQEFVTAIIAIAQMKDSNPFLKWQRKTSNFIQTLIDYISHPDRAVKFRLILS
ncbi:hypothetical protein SPRG_19732 [Saprolegnia parasitica CBS 223.65]|uniref:Uncharacterized protein n=1 Tax=Saprolegnia parasitica (strain CBS 223.65) TaxID=695850 RepID=A0A067CTJ3_SAPPC|nr:hypothetical protein SPRG_19732 [Saprolegnia parasitica CBS 223.65]KDO29851.1 hypothetical protein SPRG_19732 [Saprolegnia parasitica CBS 223.65]|eukprot:XP_012199551.1 hypothetical protein SPRG_19732 [Saprolegnia parasitica CBS 223.65]